MVARNAFSPPTHKAFACNPTGRYHKIILSAASLALVSAPTSSAFASFAIARHHIHSSRKSRASVTMTNPTQSSSNDGNNQDEITILGFGSLLSLQSSRLTFPTLRNFRLGRVLNHRRVFAHPASIFFQRNIANLDTLEMSSLSCEYEEGQSFICSVFEVPNEGLSAVPSGGGDGNAGSWIPSQAFLEREEEFDIAMVPYEEIASLEANDAAPMRTETSLSVSDDTSSSSSSITPKPLVKKGVICRRSTDEAYLAQWGKDHWESQYLKYGVSTIWGWEKDSGLRPCPVYLRHCVLASWNCGGTENKSDSWSSDGVGGLCYRSFLDDTYLVDRKTTIREYIKQYPEIMVTQPPESLRERYGG